jgi:hypothetical protein
MQNRAWGKLVVNCRDFYCYYLKLTSISGTRGGPAAMSVAFVPGCILRAELASSILCSIVLSCPLDESPRDDDFGPI